MSTVYIAGPMTGLPNDNHPAFFEAEARAKALGWEVINPARLDLEAGAGPGVAVSGVESEYLLGCIDRDVSAVLTLRASRGDALALLPGWEGHKGAVAELGLVQWKGIRVLDARTFEPFPEEPETVLEEAQRLVVGDRNGSYGHPLDDFDATGRIWGAALDRWLRVKHPEFIPPGQAFPDIPGEIGCLMMVGVKLSRECGQSKRDNRVDGAGYWFCEDRIIKERVRRA